MDPFDVMLEDGALFHSKKGKPLEMPRPLAPVADTHCHLTSLREHEPSRAIARARLAGVMLLGVPVDPVDDRTEDLSERLDAWQAAVPGWLERAAEHGLVEPEFKGFALEPANDDVRLFVGTHPYGAARFLADKSRMAELERLLDDPRAVGVGEIGLDYTCDVPKSIQREAFAWQLSVAVERNMPVELHIRDAADDLEALAHQDALGVLDEVGMPAAGVDLHCFTSDVAVMRPYVERGCYVAFGGAATFRKSDDIRDAALACPEDRLITETDCPYMAPVPLRGQECEPAMAAVTAAFLATFRADNGLAQPRETYRALWENSRRLLQL